MRKSVIIGWALVAWAIIAACFLFITPLVRSKRRDAFIATRNALKAAYLEREQDGQLTNTEPRICRIFEFTNHYAVGAADYRCVVAADSWDYRDSSNMLTITTNWDFLFIDRSGVTPLHRDDPPTGY